MNPFRSALIAGLLLAAHANGAPQDERSKPAFLGVGLESDEGHGVLVSHVVPNSAAEAAGLRAEDWIVGIAGTVTDLPDDLLTVLERHAAGDRAQLVFRRGSELHVAEITLGARPPSSEAARPARLAAVLEVLRIEPGRVVADIGFGGGWLAVGMAQAVGEQGLVYAVEIERSSVQRMKERGIPNVEAIHSKEDDVSLPGQSLDLAVLHDVASHVEKEARRGFYASIARSLKRGGRLVVFGPHGEARAMLDELAEHGFRAENEAALDRLSNPDLDERLDQGIRFVHRN